MILIQAFFLCCSMSRGQAVSNTHTLTARSVIPANPGSETAQQMNGAYHHVNLVNTSLQCHKGLIVYGGDRCEQYRRLRRTGGWTLLAGGLVSTVGVGMAIKSVSLDENSNTDRQSLANAGFGIIVAGGVVQVIGLVLAVVGKSGYQQSCAWHLQSSGNTVGLVYQF